MEKKDSKDERIIKNINEAVKNMSDFERGYLLGVAESKASEKDEKMSPDKRPLNECSKI